VWFRTKHGPILSVPYAHELNDSVEVVSRRTGSEELCNNLIAQFDELLAESARRPLVMPIVLGLTFKDGSTEKLNIPAEIWRRNSKEVAKLLVYPKGKELVQVMVDPDWETGDADLENNHYPRRIIPSRIEAFKDEASKSRVSRDLMGEAAGAEPDKKKK
jgi:hypothetical protein